MNIDFLKAGTAEFVLVHLRLTASRWWRANKGFGITVSRTTKATHTHTHTHTDNVPLTEGGKEIEKSTEKAKTGEGRKKAIMEEERQRENVCGVSVCVSVCVCVCVGENKHVE